MDIGRYHNLRDMAGVLEPIQELEQKLEEKLEQSPELSRRLFVSLGAAAVVEFYTGAAGLGHANKPKVVHVERVIGETPVSPPPTEALYVPPTTVKPAPPPETPKPSAPEPVKPTPEFMEWKGRDPNKYIKDNLKNVPGVQQLDQMHPNNHWSDWKLQLEFVDELAKSVHVDPLKYLNHGFDLSRLNIYADKEPEASKVIDPRLYVIHWTADSYPKGVDQFLEFQLKRSQRQLYFTDKNAHTFRLLKNDNTYSAHGYKLNKFSQGHEIETGEYDGKTSPVYGFSAKQMEETIMAAVRFCRNNHLPVDETTIISHYAADMLFVNPTYNPLTGQSKTIGKWDPPQELISRVIIPQAQKLDKALGSR